MADGGGRKIQRRKEEAERWMKEMDRRRSGGRLDGDAETCEPSGEGSAEEAEGDGPAETEESGGGARGALPGAAARGARGARLAGGRRLPVARRGGKTKTKDLLTVHIRTAQRCETNLKNDPAGFALSKTGSKRIPCWTSSVTYAAGQDFPP